MHSEGPARLATRTNALVINQGACTFQYLVEQVHVSDERAEGVRVAHNHPRHRQDADTVQHLSVHVHTGSRASGVRNGRAEFGRSMGPLLRIRQHKHIDDTRCPANTPSYTHTDTPTKTHTHAHTQTSKHREGAREDPYRQISGAIGSAHLYTVRNEEEAIQRQGC